MQGMSSSALRGTCNQDCSAFIYSLYAFQYPPGLRRPFHLYCRVMVIYFATLSESRYIVSNVRMINEYGTIG
jgi:hypothetical protein